MITGHLTARASAYGGGVPRLVPACVWRARSDLIVALDERFGPPVDAYVNGSQVWLRDSGPGATTVEWRLHPVGAYRRPEGLDTYEVFEATAAVLAAGDAPPVPVDRLWEGLEAFPAYGDEVEPATLSSSCTAELGIAPDVFGLVDHDRVGNEWEQTGGKTSILAALLAQLGA